MSTLDQRQAEARALRAQGLTYREIAERMGLRAHGNAWGLVNRDWTGTKQVTGRRYGDPRPYVDPAAWEWMPEGRARLAAQASALRAAGWMFREIGEELDISTSYAEALVHDPNDTKAKARKEKQKGTCVDCGAPTAYKLGSASARCRECDEVFRKECVVCRIARGGSKPERRRWSDDQLLAAVRSCVGEDGLATVARYTQTYDAAPKGSMPSLPLVVNRLNGWSNACEAAGVESGKARRANYRRQTREDCLQAVLVVANVLGRLPTYNEYADRAKGLGLPSATLVRNRVGSWSGVLKRLHGDELKAAA